MLKRVALGAAIKAIRDAKAASDPKFKGSQFAVTCLMSHSHLCNIEAGRKHPGEDVIHRIAAHLGVPVDAISYQALSEGAA
jgi:transcriptional regulator with XRE-family HTH domain